MQMQQNKIGIIMNFGKILRIVAFMLVFFSFIVLIGCGSSEEKECKVNSDCNALNSCYKATCSKDYKCVNTATPNCCGNGKCEYAKDETSKGENYCTCAKDCSGPKDKCEGFKVLSDTRYGKTYTKILEYKCNEKKECILDFDRTTQRDVPLVAEKQLSYFKLSIKTVLKKPFDITTDSIDVEIELKDRSVDLSGPVTINGIQLLKGSSLYGSMDLNKKLTNISDSFKVSFPITYVPEQIESEQSLELKIEYSFSYITDRKTNETKTKNSEIITNSLSEKLYMIRPGEKFLPPTSTTASTGAAK
jgi:hypothetical protein